MECEQVMRYDKAIKFLEECGLQHVKEVLSGGEDSEGMTEMLDDLRSMIEEIEDNTYEYYKVFEQPMSPSGLCIKPMVEKGE